MVISFCISDILKHSFRYADSWRLVDNFAWKLIHAAPTFLLFQTLVIYSIHIGSHHGYCCLPELILFHVH
uniref:Uncharacterized protein n=1 Tax=Arundo donax TaxID=35708 RepID=A0A0A8YZG1_ARUDO